MEEQTPAPQSENNSWMVSDEEARSQDPFIHDENKRDTLGRSAMINRSAAKDNKPKPPIEKKETKPSIFGGAYKSIAVKKLGYILGKDGGYKDFKGLYGKTVNGITITSDIIKNLNDLRKQSMSGATIEVKERDLQIFANKLARKQAFLKGDNPKEYGTNQVFLGLLKDRAGIIPKIY